MSGLNSEAGEDFSGTGELWAGLGSQCSHHDLSDLYREDRLDLTVSIRGVQNSDSGLRYSERVRDSILHPASPPGGPEE